MATAAASPPDARLLPAAAAAWVGALLGTAGAPSAAGTVGAVPWMLTGALVVTTAAGVAGLVGWWQAAPRRYVGLLAAVAAVVGVGVLLSGHGRVAALTAGPVVGLAAERATVAVQLRVGSDPLPRSRPAGAPAWQQDQVRLTASLHQVGRAHERSPPRSVDTPVVVLAPQSWAAVRTGDVGNATGRLRLPSRAGSVAALLDTADDPVVIGRGVSVLSLGEPPRRALRESVDGFAPAPAGLLPSLVVGDETLLTDQTREDLRVTGLAHLTAVSGANVAIVLGAVLLTARWLGVRARLLPVVGLVAIGAFVLMARPEPSVVRASAMGVVVVLGLASGRSGRGLAPLALAVPVLLLVDPWLARSVGFALSCAATAAIVVLARPWAHVAGTWMPPPLAAALAVPLAAQLACTPLLVGMSGDLSLSAVPANLLAAPAVPLATVLGIAAALVGVFAPPVGHLLAGMAMLPTGWIVAVAERAAGLPVTSVSWTGGVVLALVQTVGGVALMPAVLRSPLASLVICAALGVLLLRPGHGWPPADWVVVACDVGQGDDVVLRADADTDAAVVVDVGPDPVALDSCLDDLGVREVPLLVITHFHADHVAGVAGLDDRHVGDVLVTVLDEPPAQAAALRDWASGHGVPVSRAVPHQSGQAGATTWQVLWPERVIRGVGSAPNQASVVMHAQVEGVTLLLTGDIEPAAQQALLSTPGLPLDVDVLKVPHHGSDEQHPEFLTATSPAVALVTVGADNSYGHPGAQTLHHLASLGAVVARTDTDGDTALTVGEPGSIDVVRRGAR
jgi:competence protein ComEC